MAADSVGRTAIADELADVTIYALLLAHHYGIDLGEAVVPSWSQAGVAAQHRVILLRGN